MVGGVGGVVGHEPEPLEVVGMQARGGGERLEQELQLPAQGRDMLGAPDPLDVVDQHPQDAQQRGDDLRLGRRLGAAGRRRERPTANSSWI